MSPIQAAFFDRPVWCAEIRQKSLAAIGVPRLSSTQENSPGCNFQGAPVLRSIRVGDELLGHESPTVLVA